MDTVQQEESTARCSGPVRLKHATPCGRNTGGVSYESRAEVRLLPHYRGGGSQGITKVFAIDVVLHLKKKKKKSFV
jgi:hypothetical protein